MHDLHTKQEKFSINYLFSQAIILFFCWVFNVKAIISYNLNVNMYCYALIWISQTSI